MREVSFCPFLKEGAFFTSSRTNVRDLLVSDRERGDPSSGLRPSRDDGRTFFSCLPPGGRWHGRAVTEGVVKIRTPSRKATPSDCSAVSSLKEGAFLLCHPERTLTPCVIPNECEGAPRVGRNDGRGRKRSYSLPSLCKGGCRAERGGRVVKACAARAGQPLRLAFGNPPPLAQGRQEGCGTEFFTSSRTNVRDLLARDKERGEGIPRRAYALLGMTHYEE